VDSSLSKNKSSKTLHVNYAAFHSVVYKKSADIEGEVPVDTNKYEKGQRIVVMENTGGLAKTGYTFTGWNTHADGSGNAYSGNATFSIADSDVVLYAQWTTKPTYKVTYDGNSNTIGTVPDDGNRYETGATVTVRANSGKLEKTGATFTGWKIGSEGAGALLNGGETFVLGASDVVLYAQWTSNPTYTVLYNGNGNTSGSVPTDANNYEKGQQVVVLENTGVLAKTGYTFTGWNTHSDGSGTLYTGNATFSIQDSNVVLYAQWTTKPTYVVRYNGNGNTSGSVPEDANRYEANATVTVRANSGKLEKTGAIFTGWKSGMENGGPLLSAGETFAIGTSDVVLYAQWTSNPTFTVEYLGNGNTGGSVPIDGNNYEKGMFVKVKGNIGLLVKTSSTFAGWNTADNGSGTSYAVGDSFPMGASNVKLYAQWTSKPTYTVKYDGNGNTGGAVPDDGNRYEANATVTVRANSGKLEKTNATFTGWKIGKESGGTVLNGGETFVIGVSDVVLYAQWTSNPTFTVEYFGNGNTGGSVPAAPTNYEKGTIVKVKGNTNLLIKPGSTLSGWNTAENGSGISYVEGDSFAIGTSNVNLFAQWAINKYTVTFNTLNGSAVAAQTVTHGSFITEPTAPTLQGSTFGGWYKEQACQNVWNFASEPVIATITLFARWVKSNVAPSIVVQPVAVSIEKGSVISLSVKVNADVYPLPEYKWVKGTSDTVASGTASGGTISFAINASAYTDEGKYKVVVRNAAGQIISDQVDVKVKDVTLPVLTLNGSADTTIYLGSTWVDPMGTATDDKDVTIAPSAIVITGTVNAQTVGKYTLSYQVSDQAKNASSPKTRTVRVDGWVKVTDNLPAGNVFRAVLNSDNDLFIGLVTDQAQFVYKINSNGVVTDLNMTYDACSNSMSMALAPDNKTLFVARSCHGDLLSWNGTAWIDTISDAGVSGTSGVQVCLNIGPQGTPYLAGFFASTNTINIRRYLNAAWKSVGDSTVSLGIELNSKRSERKFCMSTEPDIYTIGNPTSGSSDIIIKKIKPNTGVTTTLDSIAASGQVTNNYCIVTCNSASNGLPRILYGFTSGSDVNPQIHRFYNGEKTTLPSPAISTTAGSGGFDMEFSTDSLLHVVHPEGSDVVVRKYDGSKWLNVPESGTGVAFHASPSDVYVAAGPDRCYVVYRESVGGKVVVMQWRKQL
jgi:uncharacterized repeat protein (TIGR02543 family)